MIVFAVGGDPWEIDELGQNAAVLAGRESCGIRKGGHCFTPYKSCGSIPRSRHIFAIRLRPISFFRSLRVVNSSPKYKRPWLPLPLSATNWQVTFLRRANFCTRRSNSAPLTTLHSRTDLSECQAGAKFGLPTS